MWIDPQTQKVFMLHAAIRAAFPSFSFPDVMTPEDIAFAGLAEVQPTQPPAHDPATHQAVPVSPVLQDGAWLEQWAIEVRPPPQVPQVVTRRQARQALLLAGLLGSVQPAIDVIADPIHRQMAQIEWDDSQEFTRTRPLLIQLSYAIGLDDAGLDALFVQAAAL